MNFKKTLLAAAVAFVGFGAQAAQETGLADVWKYKNAAGQEIYKINVISKAGEEISSGYYTYTKGDGSNSGKFTVYNGSTDAYQTLISGGQFETKYESKDGSVITSPANNEGGENHYWSVTTEQKTEPGVLNFQLDGQLVIPNGAPEQQLNGGYSKDTAGTANSINKKDVEVGKLTTQDRDFTIKGENTDNKDHGVLATTKQGDSSTSSVTALTGDGLTVVQAPQGSTVDLSTGTVSSSVVTAGGTEKRSEVRAFTNGSQKIFQVGDTYYTVDSNNKLTEYKGSTAQLEQYASGVADVKTAGKTSTNTNTGFVSSQNVTYGESQKVTDNAQTIQIGSTDPKFVQDNGPIYTLGTATGKVSELSKDVVTGIISTDNKGNNTYGLQATNTVDGKVTGQTTVTADGITTTGDITVFAGTDKETTVSGLLSKATTDLNQKISEFGSTASRLNKRINDVEETAYRGIAIALAAQQQIPNIGAGQFAVFGGVGHYEGESAGALGLAGVLADGRTSLSAALGAAGNGEVGGRVGVAYVFGGK